MCRYYQINNHFLKKKLHNLSYLMLYINMQKKQIKQLYSKHIR